MLTEQDALFDAEQDSIGHPSVWRYIYDLMRCTGPPYHLGPHCWRDPDGKKHYRLKTHHLKGLVRYVEQGGELRGHGDVPHTFQEQLYAEEQQHVERQQKDRRHRSASYPPINITNVLPTQSPQASYPTELGDMASSAPTLRSHSTDHLEVPGFLDDVVTAYTDW